MNTPNEIIKRKRGRPPKNKVSTEVKVETTHDTDSRNLSGYGRSFKPFPKSEQIRDRK